MKITLLALVSILTVGVALADYEEPNYSVLSQTDVYELRRYEPHIVAEVTVTGSFRRSGNEAFRLLAGYIFGKNQTSEKMSMTVPVKTHPANAAALPSAMSAKGQGQYTYAFVMERAYTLDTLPKPNNPRVQFRQVPEQLVAVRRYSGGWSKKKYAKEEITLVTTLKKEGFQTVGQSWLARYNGPLTPWFLRRNEVMIEVTEN